MPSLDLRSTSRPLWHATRFTLSWLVGVSVALTLVLAVVGTLGVGARPSVDLAFAVQMPMQP